MATIFADGFDVYASTSDMQSAAGGPWTGIFNGLSSSTQFSIGQCYAPTSSGTGTNVTFTSATNETTVYGSIRVFFSFGFTSTAGNGLTMNFLDGSTAQCSIKFLQNGGISVYTGTSSGTLVATVSNAFNPGVWNGFQFKVVINNSTGSIEIRVNGSTTDTVNQTGMNTRGGTSNSYVNGVGFFATTTGNTFIDDLYLNNTSGNNPVSWPGDVRCIQQTPATCTAQNFSAIIPASYAFWGNGGATTFNANTAFYSPYTPTSTFSVASIAFVMNSNLTGNVKFAIFDSSAAGGFPGSVIATSNAVNNPTTSTNNATFSSPPILVAGTTYWVGVDQDTNATFRYWGSAGSYTNTVTYASFPSATPTSLVANGAFPYTTFITAANNVAAVSEKIEDGDTSYLYSSSVLEDTYTLGAISTTYNVLACQYYVMWKKSDAGSRTAQLSVNANSSGDTAEITNSALATSYVFQFKILEKDPTGTYWTATTANSQVLGIAVTA